MMSDDAPDELELFRRYRSTDDRRLRDALVEHHQELAERAARRFARRGEPLDDLRQVALLGLLKAVERFDPDRGVPFAGFASPTIVGELRRHFRDATWAVKVNRRTKDLHVRIPAAVERLSQALERPPTSAELADDLGVDDEAVLEALEAGAAYRGMSLDQLQDAGGFTPASLGDHESVEHLAVLNDLFGHLAERERLILYLRFIEELSQQEIADRVGTSQVHVSRLIRKSLDELRRQSDDPAG